MATDCDVAIIGAGVVGLAVARALTLRGREVLVLEQHDRIGSEVSARSSEVIHAGLYYPAGSLKARLCVAGRKMLYRFAAENGVAVRKPGKLVVATRPEEIAALQRIGASARANGAGDATLISGAEARAIEPELSCVAALVSPETGVIDSHGYMQALEGHVTSRGGQVVLETRITGLAALPEGGFAIEAESGGASARLSAGALVISAGLGASTLGRMLAYREGYRVPETYFGKGHYFALSGRVPFSRLVYPLPGGGGLGVHLTLDTGGQAKFGPDIAWQDSVDYAFEDESGARRKGFEREIRRYWPGLPEDSLSPGYTGIRPKLTRAGAPAADFAIHGPDEHGVPGLVALYGIESPGITASLAIGEHVGDMLAA